METAEQAEAFLSPSLDHLHDPHLLAGLPEALERLLQARRDDEVVAVVGDYDVDGVSATALLMAVLRACGLRVEAVLPHRLREGYGFQPVHVERAAEVQAKVIVTVDCGVSSSAAVEAAVERGIDVLITDHHLPGEGLPSGAIVVNPRQEGCAYPFPDLAGVGLAFKLSSAFAERCERPIDPLRLLRIACLGTIADLVPLVGENRVIAALGLQALAETRSPGLRALMKTAGIQPPLTADDVGYKIGPRINAAGRLADPQRALDLLMSRDSGRAQRLAGELEQHNRDRRAAEQQAVEEAREQLLSRDPLPQIGVAWSAGWHRGVVGIAAGRLARELSRPVVLLAVDGEQATGSGRSVPGIHLHDFLDGFRDAMERFGGHAQAVGMTVRTDALESLRESWEEGAQEWPEKLLRRRYEYEMELPVRQLSMRFLQRLRRLEPYGQSNPRPLIRVEAMRWAGAPRVFGKGHLSGTARSDDGSQVHLLGWGWEARRQDLEGRFEALGYLEYDSYRRAPVLRLVDGRPVEAA